jgi:ABC-type transport system substrate-binding protein
MSIRRFLIVAPMVISLILACAYFWVPTYEDQTKGNPHRLVQFVTASGGDATILNPVLSSNSTSSEIEGQVFEGLIDYDENLQHRGRVAKSWQVYEQAYFYINPKASSSKWGRIDDRTLVEKLSATVKNNPEKFDHVTAVDLLPPRTFEQKFTFKKDEETRSIILQADAPARIRITLSRVDQELFKNLSEIMGDDYFSSFRPLDYVQPTDAAGNTDADPQQLAEWAGQMVPTTVHNPVIEFKLRQGVKFHDGHEVTAEDVKFTYDTIVHPNNISALVPYFEPVQTVEILDRYDVRITYKRLYSNALLTWGTGIMPEHLLNEKALTAEAKRRGIDPEKFTLRQSEFNRHPVGCGPFIFDDWKSDQYIRLKRFDDYWDGPAKYRQYVMRIIPDPLTQEMEFYAGTIDDYHVLPHQVARLKKDERFQHFSSTSFGYTYIGYNMRREPFNDPRVRRALGMAIDNQKIIDHVLYGQAEPITGPFAKQTDYYNQDVAPLPYDPEGALRLLKSAGWERGADGYLYKSGKRLAFTMITNNGNVLRKAILAIAQDAWKKLGIQVETDLLEWSVFIEKRINQLDFDAVVLGWSTTIEPDPYQVWHSSQTHPYQSNFIGYADPKADELIIKIRREFDHQRKVDYCHQLHKIIADAQPYTFLYVARVTALLDKRIVREVAVKDGKPVYAPIVATKTGNFKFHFNQWVKLPEAPVFNGNE